MKRRSRNVGSIVQKNKNVRVLSFLAILDIFQEPFQSNAFSSLDKKLKARFIQVHVNFFTHCLFGGSIQEINLKNSTKAIKRVIHFSFLSDTLWRLLAYLW